VTTDSATRRFLRRRARSGNDQQALIGQSKAIPYVFSGPALVTIAIVLAFPVVFAFYGSLQQAEFIGQPLEFVGLDNYVALAQDAGFWSAFGKSVIFVTGCVVFGQALAIFFAFVLNSLFKGLRFIRGMMVLPYIVSSVALAVMFRVTFNQELGIPNQLLALVGIEGPAWLGQPVFAMIVVILAQVWSDIPLSVLLILGGLQTIDQSLLDASLVDGATGWSRARFVSLPLIAPQLVLSTLWLSYTSFTTLGVILALTGGGPGTATQTLTLEMYDTAFRALDFQKALAIAVLLLVFNAIISTFYLRIARRYSID
jgi:ABC-type sugar transport system permease subunit